MKYFNLKSNLFSNDIHSNTISFFDKIKLLNELIEQLYYDKVVDDIILCYS